MKKLLLIGLVLANLPVFAQHDNGDRKGDGNGFQMQRLFTGGDVNLGFSSYTTNLGLSPQLGISLTDWIDAGVSFNFNYTSQRDPNTPDKAHLTTVGPGVFARIFPIDFLFASIQYEYNFITYKFISNAANGNQKTNLQAPSLLLGIGYAGGRMRGTNTYYYFTVSGDFLGNKNSPYIDNFERMIPVVRAGFNFGLFQGRGR